MSSEALNPEPVTELPLTPPAEDDEDDAAIALTNYKIKTNTSCGFQHKHSKKAQRQTSLQTLSFDSIC